MQQRKNYFFKLAQQEKQILYFNNIIPFVGGFSILSWLLVHKTGSNTHMFLTLGFCSMLTEPNSNIIVFKDLSYEMHFTL